MWADWALPRLRVRGLGAETARVTLRTTGIGESALADRLGSLLDRGANPTVATYARADAVDIRISAVPGPSVDAAALVDEAERAVMGLIGGHVWARGDSSWAQAIAAALDVRGWSLAIHESGLRGTLPTLLSEGLGERLRLVQSVPESRETLSADARERTDGPLPTKSGLGQRPRDRLVQVARAVRASSGADIGLAVEAATTGRDMTVNVSIVDPRGDHTEQRLAFIDGPMGRSRAALQAAAVLLARLR